MIKLHEKTAECHIVNKFGIWRFVVYRHKVTSKEHIALISVKTDFRRWVNVRIHSSCTTGDIFLAKDCDCREQLNDAMSKMGKTGGIVFYLLQEGRDIGLTNKIRAYALKERGFNTVEANVALGLPAENRTYEMVGEMLDELGVKKVKLITNNPDKIDAVKKMGIKVKVLSAETEPNKWNKSYLYTKKKMMNHKLEKSKNPITK